MKTQLLEDIGQSATLSLVPSARAANSKADNGVQVIAQAPAATSVRPRSAFGVWRQKPAGEPVIIPAQQPYQQPAEPVAAEEAQPVPAQPVPEAVVPRDEPTLAASATHGPVFDFTLPSPATPAPDPLNPEPGWLERSGQRNLLWGACMLAAALVILGGLWFYEARKDASALALVADEVKAEPQVDKAVKLRAIAAKEFTLGPDGEARVTPAAPPAPPLVLLKPEPATVIKAESTSVPKTDREELQAPPRRELARLKRAPDRQLARAPVLQVERKTEPDSTMAATLKACREYGYQPAQCVKRGCSMTKYGFVCRGK